MRVRENRRTEPQSGFTLIELLVVLCIIAILAALGLPSYKAHKDQARIANAVRLADECVRPAFALFAGRSEGAYPAEADISSDQGLVSVARANGCDLPDGIKTPGRVVQQPIFRFWDYRCLRYDPPSNRWVLVPCFPIQPTDPRPDDYQLLVKVPGIEPDLSGAFVLVSQTQGATRLNMQQATDILNFN